MGRVIHFELNVDNPQRAADFYAQVFGWEINKWEGPVDYWLITTGDDAEPGINGAIMTGAAAPTVNTIDVTSVDESAEKIRGQGGKVVSPRTTVPGVGYFYYCEDSEGNTFGIMESDPPAQ